MKTLIKLATILTLMGLILTTGCETAPSVKTHGINNLIVLQPGRVETNNLVILQPFRARGGQPDAEGFHWLLSQGCTNIFKLNEKSEGSDKIAEELGMNVYYFPMSTCEQLIVRPNNEQLHKLVEMWMLHGGFVHCLNGWDRTGLFCGCGRLWEGWSKEDAYAEMIKYGFHEWLQALKGRWDSEQPEYWYPHKTKQLWSAKDPRSVKKLCSPKDTR